MKFVWSLLYILMHHALLLKNNMLFLPSSFVCSNEFLSPHTSCSSDRNFLKKWIWMSNVHLEWVLHCYFPMFLPECLLVVISQESCWFPNYRHDKIIHIVPNQQRLHHTLNKMIVIWMIIFNICVPNCIKFWSIELVTMIWLSNIVFDTNTFQI